MKIFGICSDIMVNIFAGGSLSELILKNKISHTVMSEQETKQILLQLARVCHHLPLFEKS